MKTTTKQYEVLIDGVAVKGGAFSEEEAQRIATEWGNRGDFYIEIKEVE